MGEHLLGWVKWDKRGSNFEIIAGSGEKVVFDRTRAEEKVARSAALSVGYDDGIICLRAEVSPLRPADLL